MAYFTRFWQCFYEKDRNTLEEENKALKEQNQALYRASVPLIEEWCSHHYPKISNIAYKQKRDIKGIYYSTYLNEYITPNAWEVQNIKRKLDMTGNIANTARIIGNYIASRLTWTSDENLATSGDYYLFPAEILTYRKGDCEDHAFTVASLNPEIGVAYGFLENMGHAFNVFVFADRLFVLDTVGNEGDIIEYKPGQNYTIHFIITKNSTFQLKGGVNFGEIAGWK
jgi:signal peptidase I